LVDEERLRVAIVEQMESKLLGVFLKRSDQQMRQKSLDLNPVFVSSLLKWNCQNSAAGFFRSSSWTQTVLSISLNGAIGPLNKFGVEPEIRHSRRFR
jgi:hypothetical protein